MASSTAVKRVGCARGRTGSRGRVRRDPPDHAGAAPGGLRGPCGSGHGASMVVPASSAWSPNARPRMAKIELSSGPWNPRESSSGVSAGADRRHRLVTSGDVGRVLSTLGAAVEAQVPRSRHRSGFLRRLLSTVEFGQGPHRPVMERLHRSDAELGGQSIERQPWAGVRGRHGGAQPLEFLGTVIGHRS